MKPVELERQYRGEEAILAAGSTARELYVVRSGNVMLDALDGSEPRLLGPGEVFGELGAILGEPNRYAVRADGDASVLALDLTTLNKLCAESPDFSARLIRHLAQELASGSQAQGARPGDEGLAPGIEKLVPVILGRCEGTETPVPVRGRLRELAEDAKMSMLDAYLCVQSLLEERHLQLVDDQLSVVEVETLKRLAG